MLHIGTITEIDEKPLIRTRSLGSGYRAGSFCNAVRARDRGCVLTGRPAILAQFGNWRGFEACHIYPLGYEEDWNRSELPNAITIPPAHESYGSINSIQNGILLGSDIHKLFDGYEIAINPKV